jgi:lysophospholipase L1-like esterase
MPRLLAAVAALILASPAIAADPPEDFFFKKGDRIIYTGDSITEQYQYSSYIELYLTTRFPAGNFFFLNAGIGGDTATGGANRFRNHVLAEKPTAVTTDFGMNDGGYGGFNPDAAKRYAERTAAMLDMARKAEVRVALISPNAVDKRTKPGLATYLETQKRFYEPLKALAQEHGIPFVDQYAVTRAALEKMAADDPDGKKVNPFPDGVHTSGQGGVLMAHTILVGLHAPAVVSEVSIDARDGGVNAQKCIVENLQATTAGVSFTRTDEALPVPVQKDWLPVLPYVAELKDLNRYGLQVAGLKDGDYAVEIDGTEVGKYTAKQLADGVNLGNLTAGPVWEQANQVFKAIDAKNKIVHQRFRGVVMYQIQPADWLGDLPKQVAERRAAELTKRMEKIEAAQAEVYKLAGPRPHKFEVKPAK